MNVITHKDHPSATVHHPGQFKNIRVTNNILKNENNYGNLKEHRSGVLQLKSPNNTICVPADTNCVSSDFSSSNNNNTIVLERQKRLFERSNLPFTKS